MLLWFCADVCGRWLVHMKIQTSCNGFYGDVYKGYRTSHNECLCIFSRLPKERDLEVDGTPKERTLATQLMQLQGCLMDWLTD